MIARFDHRPMLTALLALSTTVLLVVVITLSTLLISSPQAASPPSGSAGGNPGAVSGAGSSEVGAAPEISLKRHAEVVAAYTK